MIRRITFAAMLLACACTQPHAGSEPANETANVSQGPAPAEEVPALAGEWQVMAVNGRLVDAASAMVATFGDGKVHVASGCLRRAWTYTQKRNMVAFAPAPGESSNCGASPSGEQETAYAAVDLATMAIFGKDSSQVSLSGNGGTLTLQRR